MRGLIVIALFALANFAHAEPPQKIIDVQHDAIRGVTCWILNDRAISCLPDSQLRQPAPKAGANPASAPTPHQHDEVFQL